MRPSAFLALVAVAAPLGSCVPARDNPHDPKNAPHPALLVVDVSDEIGNCPAITDFSSAVSYPSTGAASHGRCFALDARASRDVSGRLPKRFDFGTLSGDALEPLPPEALAAVTGSAGSVVLLAQDWVRALPPRQAVTFAVRVHDGNGGSGIAMSSFTPLNNRPVARTEASRILPVGGFTWNRGAPFSVVFRERGSFDPDGDPLTFCWTFPDAATPICSDDPEDPAFIRSVPVTAGRYRATLEVRDGDDALPSLPAFDSLRVEDPPVYRFNLSSAEAIRLDSAATEILFPGSFGGTGVAARLLPDGGGLPTALVVTGDPSTGDLSLFAARMPDLSPVGNSIAFPATDAIDMELFPAANGSASWIVVRAMSGDFAKEVTVASDLTITPGLATNLPSGFSLTGSIATADALGGLWLARVGNTSLIARLPSGGGAAVIVEDDPSVEIAGLDSRPDTTEIWTLVRPAVIGSAPDAIRIHDASDPLGVPRELPLGSGLATGLAFWTRDRVWLLAPGEGLVLADAAALAAGASIDAAALVRFPDVTAIDGPMAVDPREGTAWLVTDGFSTLLQARIDGGTVATPMDAESTMAFVDGDGNGWFDGELYDFLRGQTTDRDRLATDVGPVSMAGGVQVDVATGGFWTYSTDSFGSHFFERHAPNGSVELVAETAVQLQGGGRIAPDGTAAWGFQYVPAIAGYALMHVVLPSAGVSTQDISVLDASQDSSVESWRLGNVFEPSAPLPASTPFVWVREAGDIEAVDGSGVISAPAFNVPVPERNFSLKASLSPKTNGLCLFTRENDVYRARRVAVGGGATLLGTEGALGGSPGSGVLSTVGWTTQDGDEVCWTAFAETTSPTSSLVRVQAWTEAGVVLHSETVTIPGALTPPIAVSDDDRVWLAIREAVPYDSKVARIDFAATTSGGTLVVLPGKQFVDLILAGGR